MDRIIDPRISGRGERYLAQVAMATLTLFLIFAVEDALSRAAILTALAASTFLVFVNPEGVMSQPRRILGGHFVAIVIAGAFSLVLYDLPWSGYIDHGLPFDAVAATSVGAAMLCMSVTNTEHPPAAGTVVGLVITPWNLGIAALVLVSAGLLTMVRVRFGHRLSDLV